LTETESPTREPTISPSHVPTELPTTGTVPSATPTSTATILAPQTVSAPESLSPSSAPSTCSSDPREKAFLRNLVDVTSPVDLVDHTTFSGAAFRWIVYGDRAQVDVCTYPAVQQRFALATLYFATEGNGWTDNSTWLTGEPECNWLGVFCEGGLVTFLSLCKNIQFHGM